MINKLPFIGWLLSFGWFLSFIANVSLSVPFWLFWTHWSLGRTYFYQLPAVYFNIPFWDCVGLFLILGILRGLLPTIISIHQSNSGGSQSNSSESLSKSRKFKSYLT